MIGHAAQVEPGQVLATDVCIVGAGAAGVTLALALQGSGLDTLVLEGGQDRPDAAAQDLYAGEVADPRLHSPPLRYRVRQLGGATTIWGGRCVPLDPQDLEERPAVPGGAWPIAYAELARWYPLATAWCEAGQGGYDATSALPPGTPPLWPGQVPPDLTVDGLERFSCPTDFGARYRARLERAPGLRLLLDANVVGIGLRHDGTAVERLQVASLGGRRFEVRARVVVLAVGGLETPRLLLASREVHANGIGNANDQVGRHYMCHLAGSVGRLRLHGSPRAVRHGYERTADGIYVRRRIALGAEAQRRLGVANLCARLHFPEVADPAHGSAVLSGIWLTRRLLSYEYSRRVAAPGVGGPGAWVAHLGNVLRHPQDAAAFLGHWALRRSLAARKFPSVILRNRRNMFSLEINAEQRPLPHSRVTLAQDRDALGLPRLRVDWRYAAEDIASVGRSLEAIGRGLEAGGIGRYEFDAQTLEADLTRYGAYGGHHIGTARMASDERQGVLDAQARVYGVANLYVAGSAVFPSSGQANPTLTLVALALRLAEHLARTEGRAHDVARALA